MYYPAYDGYCAPWARRRFGLPRCGERHLDRPRRRKVTGRTKTEVREKLKKLQAEADAGLKTSASHTVAKAVDDWAAEALDGLADKTVRSHVDLLRPVTMLIGNVPLRDLTAQDVRRTLSKLAQTRSTRTMASTHNVLVRAIRHAEANDHVGRNVASLVKPPQGKTGRLSRAMTAARTAWAPPYAGKELRLSRLGAFDAALAAIRADAETAAARKARDHDRAARHEHLAASYRALRDHYQQRGHVLTQDVTARREWEHATERSRRLAIAADAELRRRHPGRKIEPLRSAEPAPASDTGCDPLHPAADGRSTEPTALISDLAMQHEQFRAQIDEHPPLIAPGEDHGTAFRARKTPGQDAILQPPKPEITPSDRILQLAAEHDIEPEAGG